MTIAIAVVLKPMAMAMCSPPLAAEPLISVEICRTINGKVPVPISTADEACVAKAAPNSRIHTPNMVGVRIGSPTRRQNVHADPPREVLASFHDVRIAWNDGNSKSTTIGIRKYWYISTRPLTVYSEKLESMASNMEMR